MKVDPELEALINSVLAADKGRVSAVAKKKKGTKPTIAFSGIADKDPYNPEPGSSHKKSAKGKSTFHTLLDYALRPVRAVEGAIYEGHEADTGGLEGELKSLKGIGTGFWHGLSGQSAHTGKDVINQMGFKGRGAGTAGTVLDLAIDPLNALPVGKILGALGKVDAKAAAKLGLPERGLKPVEQIAAKLESPTIAAKQPTSIFKGAPDIAQAPVVPMPDISPAKLTNSLFGKTTKAPKTPAMRMPAVPAARTAEQAAKVVAENPTTVLKAVPKPKPIELHELPAPTLKKINENAWAKAGNSWIESGLAGKFGRGVRLDWHELVSNPAKFEQVKAHPEFRKWFAGILNAEKNRAVSEINAARMAAYHAAVKAAESTVETAKAVAPVKKAAARTITTVDPALPKPLSDTHLSAVTRAWELHLTNNGDRALTPLGQAKLRQTVANEYFKAKPNAIKHKNSPNVLKTINRMYVEAEKRLVQEMGHEGPLLSNIIDNLKPADFTNPAILAGHIGDVTPGAMAVKAAADLPNSVKPTFISTLLKNLEESGSAVQAVQIRNNIKLADVKFDPNFPFKAEAAVAKDAGEESVRLLPKVQEEKVLKRAADYVAKAGHYLEEKFNSQYLQTKWEHSAIQSAKNSIVTAKEKDINQTLRQLVRGTNKQGFNDAFAAAKKNRSGELPEQIVGYMERLTNLMKNAGVTEAEFVEMLGRSRAFKNMKLDVTQGWDIWRTLPDGEGHAAKLMAHYANAAHNATLKTNVVGQVGHLFGLVNGMDDAKLVAQARKEESYVRIKGISQEVYVPKDYAHRIEELLDLVTPKGAAKADEFFRFYDKGLGFFKTGLTKYLPSHHITNDIGNKYMAWLDGLTDIRWYQRAMSVMAHQESAATGVAKGSMKGGLTTGSGHYLSQAEIMPLFESSGLRTSSAGLSDMAGDIGNLSDPKVKNSIATMVDRASSARENHNKLAHFMFALSQEKGPLADAVQAAAMRVQRHHADYNDLTPFEQKVMRRVIPFYTWQRKVAPTLLMQALHNPAKIMVYPKIQQDINQHFGIKPDPSNPFPGDAMTPSFMTESIQALYGHRDNGNAIWGGFRTPFEDVLGRQINHPVGNILDMLTPAVKIPYELQSGTSIGNNDIHVTSKDIDTATYLENNTPFLSVLMRLTRKDPAHGFRDMRSNEDEKGTNIPALINLLTAAGLRENTGRMQEIAKRENAPKKKKKKEDTR